MKSSIWKKSIVIATLCTFAMASNLAFPRRAHAIIGAGALNPSLMLIGGAYVLLVGGGVSGILTGVSIAVESKVGTGIFGTLAVCAAIAGIVLLDNEQGVYTYQEMTTDAAKKLKVKEENRVAYNAELDKVNLLSKTVTEQLSLERNPTVETSVAIWKQYQDRLSPEAAVAFQQINQSLVSAAMKRAQ